MKKEERRRRKEKRKPVGWTESVKASSKKELSERDGVVLPYLVVASHTRMSDQSDRCLIRTQRPIWELACKIRAVCIEPDSGAAT